MATKPEIGATEPKPSPEPIATPGSEEEAPPPKGISTPQAMGRGAALLGGMGWIGGLLALMMILVTTIIVVALLVLDVPTRQTTLGKLFGFGPDLEAASWQSPGGKELISASGVHYLIAAPIAKCL